jgi:hypothetical protein
MKMFAKKTFGASLRFIECELGKYICDACLREHPDSECTFDRTGECVECCLCGRKNFERLSDGHIADRYTQIPRLMGNRGDEDTLERSHLERTVSAKRMIEFIHTSDQQTAVEIFKDALIDLRHLAFFLGISYDETSSSAENHFSQEAPCRTIDFLQAEKKVAEPFKVTYTDDEEVVL